MSEFIINILQFIFTVGGVIITLTIFLKGLSKDVQFIFKDIAEIKNRIDKIESNHLVHMEADLKAINEWKAGLDQWKDNQKELLEEFRRGQQRMCDERHNLNR